MVLGAIDIGSNGVRLAIARVEHDRLVPLEASREAIRLGTDVFGSGLVAPSTLDRLARGLKRFRERLDVWGAERTRAVATSALREAHNRTEVLDRIRESSGIDVEVIHGEEEARLIFRAVSARRPLEDRLALLIDLGGGSVEVSVAENGVLTASSSFRMGAVRLLENLSSGGEEEFHVRVGEWIDGIRRHLRAEIGERPIERTVGTGGNVESLADLCPTLAGETADEIRRTDLATLADRLRAMSLVDRVEKLGLRPDRADVIVPAALVLHHLLCEARSDRMVVPRVSLKDGILLELLDQVQGIPLSRLRNQVLASARRLGRRYRYDEEHAWAVARLAARIFDQTAAMHGLGEEARTLLEAAAVVHDIGQIVNMGGHHKHTGYLVQNSPFLGLNDHQRVLVATIARYHRKSFPKAEHLPYGTLCQEDRLLVDRLAAILRLADALDAEHSGRVADVDVRVQGRRVMLRLGSSGTALLERWALGRKARLFEKVFDVEVRMDTLSE